MPPKVNKMRKKAIKQKQKQRQQQSVIVRIDQSKRVVQRKAQETRQPISQPVPMNIMIAPPPQLSIDDSIKLHKAQLTSQQEQQIKQPIQQTNTRPQQTLQLDTRRLEAGATAPLVDNVEETPVFTPKAGIVSSDIFKEAKREGDELQERGTLHNTLLRTPNRFEALSPIDEEDELQPLEYQPAHQLTAHEMITKLLESKDITEEEEKYLKKRQSRKRTRKNKELITLYNEKFRK